MVTLLSFFCNNAEATHQGKFLGDQIIYLDWLQDDGTEYEVVSYPSGFESDKEL